MSTPTTVYMFVSYCRADGEFMDEFLSHTAGLCDEADLEIFHDRLIKPGRWEEQIRRHLVDANIFVALRTANYRRSDQCYEVELGGVLPRYEAGTCRIFVVHVSPVHLKSADPLSYLQHFPSGTALSEYQDGERDRRWTSVVKELSRMVDEIQGTDAQPDNDASTARDELNVSGQREMRHLRLVKSDGPRVEESPWQPLVDALSASSFTAGTWSELALSTRRLRAALAEPWPPHPLVSGEPHAHIEKLAAVLNSATDANASRHTVRQACAQAAAIKRWLLEVLTMDDEVP